MDIHVYKGHVIELVKLEKYDEIKYVGDVYCDGDLVWTSYVDPAEAGALSVCVHYIDKLGDKVDE